MLCSTSFPSILRSLFFSLLSYLLLWLSSSHCAAEMIPVKSAQAAAHTFLVLRTEEGMPVAVGEMTQTVHDAQVTTRVKFQFDDGSKYEETTVFSQHGIFQVLSDHTLQTGPSFKDPMEVWIDRRKGEVKVRDMKPGKDKDNVISSHLKIPADLANGILPVIVENFPNGAAHTVTMLAATPKPRVVKLVLSPQGEDTFLIAKTRYKATHYVAKVEIGGIAGAVASLAGKQPPNTEFWVFKGSAPVFLKSAGPLSADNIIWQIELAVPAWAGDSKKEISK